MIGLVLLFAIWPFHHKKPAGDPERNYVEFNGTLVWDTTDGLSPAGLHPPCDKVDDLWFYMGDDKMIGISPASCEAAIHNWTLTHVDPVKMSRS